MNREALKAMGLTDEQIESVMKSHGDVVNTTKQDLSDVTTERDTLQETLNKRDEQLNALKDVKPDELKQQITDLQTANEDAKKEHAATVKDLQLSSAIKLALNGQVHDDDMASSLIDKENLVIGDGGKVVGLDEQVARLKESKSFLFVQEEKKEKNPNIFVPGNPNGGAKTTTSREQIMKEKDATKRQKMIRENSHLFQ